MVAVSAPRTSIQPWTSAPEQVAVMPVSAPALKLPTEETLPSLMKPVAPMAEPGVIGSDSQFVQAPRKTPVVPLLAVMVVP